MKLQSMMNYEQMTIVNHGRASEYKSWLQYDILYCQVHTKKGSHTCITMQQNTKKADKLQEVIKTMTKW